MFNPDTIRTKKYILLETYRKNGQPVKTPVWFVIKDDSVIVVTREQTGKIKRLRNDQRIRIATCSVKGKVSGPWMSGTAKIAAEDETLKAVKLRNKKYGFLAKIAAVLSRKKGSLLAITIKVD